VTVRLPRLILRVVDHGDETVAVATNIENHISINRIGILEYRTHLGKVPPPCRLSNCDPGFQLLCRILEGFGSVTEMLARYEVHKYHDTSQIVKLQDSFPGGFDLAVEVRLCIGPSVLVSCALRTAYLGLPLVGPGYYVGGPLGLNLDQISTDQAEPGKMQISLGPQPSINVH